MTGPEHYRLAEAFITTSQKLGQTAEIIHACIATAQVHATLALAAASVRVDYTITGDGPVTPDGGEWARMLDGPAQKNTP